LRDSRQLAEGADNPNYIVLSPLEAWGALFEEGCNTLACVVRRDDAGESGFLDRQPIVDRCIHAAMDGRERGGKRGRRLCG
jgi:hypothetical protein